MWSRLPASIVLGAALAAGCASHDAVPISTKVGPKGGMVIHAGSGVILTIPAGALAEERNFSITETKDPAPDEISAYSPIFRFQPEGLRFAKPVTVRLPYTGEGAVTVYWTKAGESVFEPVATTAAGYAATATIEHFSRGFVGRSEPGQGDSGTIRYDSGTVRYDSGSVRHDSGTVRHDSSTVRHDSSTVRHDSSTVRHDSSTVRHDSSTVRHDSSTVRHDGGASYQDSGTVQEDSGAGQSDTGAS